MRKVTICFLAWWFLYVPLHYKRQPIALGPFSSLEQCNQMKAWMLDIRSKSSPHMWKASECWSSTTRRGQK